MGSFQDHLRSKQNNLDELADGTINYGEYNRKEMELGQQLAGDLQFLDEKYRPEVRRQPTSISEAPIPVPGRRSATRDAANVVQILFLELLWALPKLIL